MEANHEKPETQKTLSGDREAAQTAPVALWRGEAQCGWRLFPDPTDHTHYRHCRHHDGHKGDHEPVNGGPPLAGELWWKFPAITGTTIAELERPARVVALVYVSEIGPWSIELFQEGDGYRAEATRAGMNGYGSVTKITRGRSAYETLAEAKSDAEAYDRLVLA